ncbi:DUF952 domain-containing protein [Oceanispirochaeta sp. M1]|uniref:DUF952 domain-containing protein n=1 Tax=unclassified Oceanispirochaeta TaxID=2635722 RepID=UPI0021023450|nr:DUF952 domain-containing protein [Oceanispirochaeta sp. M1]
MYNKQSMSGYYAPESIQKEGFIHCSYSYQICDIANEFYKSEEDLILLQIDKSLIQCEIIDEDTDNRNENFPHIYGELPTSSVIGQYLLKKDSNGNYILPVEFPELTTDNFCSVGS